MATTTFYTPPIKTADYDTIDELYELKAALTKLSAGELKIADALIREVVDIVLTDYSHSEADPIIKELLDYMSYDGHDYGDIVNQDFAIELDDDSFDYRDHLTNARNLWVFREIKAAIEAAEEDMEI